MYKKYIWLLLFVFTLTGCSLVTTTQLPQITIDDMNKNFDFEEGDRFQVILPANHTTGYQWEIDEFSEDNLELISNNYKLSDKYDEDIVGAGGEEVFVFRVIKVSRSRIRMNYLKTWDELDIANSFAVTINGNPDDGLLTYIGKIHSLEPGAEYDDYFETEDGITFGIEPFMVNKIADPGVEAKMKEYTDTDSVLEIRGKMTDDVPDYNGKQFLIHEIQLN